MLMRDVTIEAGSAGPALTSAPGRGCSHGISGCAVAGGAAGSSPGLPRPDGSGRRLLFSSEILAAGHRCSCGLPLACRVNDLRALPSLVQIRCGQETQRPAAIEFP